MRKTLRPTFSFGWTNNYLQRPGEGKVKNVTLLPGVGIGPEITSKKKNKRLYV